MDKDNEKKFFAWVFSKPFYWIILFLVLITLLSDEELRKFPLLLIGLLFIAALLLIPFAVYRGIKNSIKRKTFPKEINGWKWVIYLIGIMGIFSPLFWLVQLFANFWAEEKEGFFSKVFHKVTYFFGWIAIISFVLMILAIVFL